MRKLINTAPFMGDIAKKNYFEGWFYKLVTRDSKRVISIICGIATGDSFNTSASFIQLNCTKCGTLWQKYPLSAFDYNPDKFWVTVGKSEFSDKELRICDVIDGSTVMGKIFFENTKPYPQTFYSPSIMGPFSYIPNMQCNHGVVSMGHRLMGNLTINGEIIDFTGGVGYIEKDYGTSFPSSYLWMQCNSFNKIGSSLMLAIADIPFGAFSFMGIISFFYHKGKMLSISTYNGGKIKKLEILDKLIICSITNGTYSMDIECEQQNTGKLKSPIKGRMIHHIEESLDSLLKVTVYEESGEIVYSGFSDCCASEVGGDMNFVSIKKFNK